MICDSQLELTIRRVAIERLPSSYGRWVPYGFAAPTPGLAYKLHEGHVGVHPGHGAGQWVSPFDVDSSGQSAVALACKPDSELRTNAGRCGLAEPRPAFGRLVSLIGTAALPGGKETLPF
jgi:hypothetical protein